MSSPNNITIVHTCVKYLVACDGTGIVVMLASRTIPMPEVMSEAKGS